MSFFYLATPYSKFAGGKTQGFIEAAKQAALLTDAGVPVLCPITHSHPVAACLRPERDTHELWMNLDRHFMDAAKGLIVCQLPGWDESYGVQQEIAHFYRSQKPIIMMEPGVIPPQLLPAEVLFPAEDKAKAPPADDANPKDAIGRTKTPLRLIPSGMLVHVANVMKLGAEKYGEYNWRSKRVNRTVYLEAAQRHILQALDGADEDLESGEPHEAHAAACMGIILDAMATGNLIDDRPTPGAASKLMEAKKC